MTAFTPETSAEANAKQQQNYTDVSAEMRRRQALRKTHSGGKGTPKDNSRRAKLGWEKRRNGQKQTEESR